MKQQFRNHCQDMVALVHGCITASDTFAHHFASHLEENLSGPASAKDVQALFMVKVKWKGNPFSVMKSFWTHSCQLCVNEKVNILGAVKVGELGKVMNSWLKWNEGCPHVTHFHRFSFCASADEDKEYPEKVFDNHSEGDIDCSASLCQTLLGLELV